MHIMVISVIVFDGGPARWDCAILILVKFKQILRL